MFVCVIEFGRFIKVTWICLCLQNFLQQSKTRIVRN
jgi:hypothetical protein